MVDEKRCAYFKGEKILEDIPANITPEQVRERLVAMMPELASAKYSVREGSNDIDFLMTFGEKG
jgi:hypothetical protein